MEIREALTFDDVLLEPGPSEVLPSAAARVAEIYRVQEAGPFFIPARYRNKL